MQKKDSKTAPSRAISRTRLSWLVVLLPPLLLACNTATPTEARPTAETREPVNAWLARRTFKRDLIHRYGHARYLNLFAAQIWAESRWRANAVSPVGAFGCAQFMPPTQGDAKYWAADLGRIDWADCTASSRAGIRYLKTLTRRIKRPTKPPKGFDFECYTMSEAVADYNRGMGNGDKERAVGYCIRNAAACAETANYRAKIFGPYQTKFYRMQYGEHLVCQ